MGEGLTISVETNWVCSAALLCLATYSGGSYLGDPPTGLYGNIAHGGARALLHLKGGWDQPLPVPLIGTALRGAQRLIFFDLIKLTRNNDSEQFYFDCILVFLLSDQKQFSEALPLIGEKTPFLDILGGQNGV